MNSRAKTATKELLTALGVVFAFACLLMLAIMASLAIIGMWATFTLFLVIPSFIGLWIMAYHLTP